MVLINSWVRDNNFVLGLLVIFIIGLLMGGIIGFVIGLQAGVEWAVEKGFYFLKLKGFNLGVDEDHLKYAIMQYEGQIDICYPGLAK